MARIAIVGGYGLVGKLIARELRDAMDEVDLVLVGRAPDDHGAVAEAVGASLARFDVADPDADRSVFDGCDVIIAAVQDPGEVLVAAAIDAGAAYLTITRGPDRIAPTVFAAVQRQPSRPIVPAAHWMAGAVTWAALDAARGFERVDGVLMTTLFDYADPIGPLTAQPSEDFGKDMAVIRRDGAWRQVAAAETGRMAERADGPAYGVQAMSVLDVVSTGTATGAADVRFEIGTGDSAGTLAGREASADIDIVLSGIIDGKPGKRQISLRHPQGQAHLTALGAALIARGLADSPVNGGGIALPETVVDPASAIAALQAAGLTVTTRDI
ncbi:MAG: hypothetical protein DI569_11730 [Sphingopyxis macrogoltabida]|uniref:Saccharopine dehydrogenase NADP binding domain-containing protein n=1 Tax=Sphingopyxis macrogoltabida TaxID=33050 RepID=A0A2W5KX47_SPHMC|nr:MAG: hypothetical protein DI569_11730 [Sphingopyxis macrogoltabida]